MMQQPLIWLAIALVAILLVGYFAWRSRSRRLRLRIEPVPQARLDSTPVERTEIVSPVRVRNRDGSVAGDSAEALPEPTPQPESAAPAAAGPAEPMVVPAEAVMTDLGAAEPLEVAATAAADDLPAAEPVAVQTDAVAEPVVPRLSQADLFPEATVPVQPRRSPRTTPLFAAADAGAPVDATLKSGNGSEALPDIELVISLHVMARDKAFDGTRLLELLLQYGLRFGEMNIFHRHEFPTGHGVVLFSLAQAMEPGTFNLDTLERETVPGVSLFLSLPGYKSLTAYDLMVDTARRLATELGGDLLDQHSQAVTAGQLDTWRDQVTAFERKRLMSS